MRGELVRGIPVPSVTPPSRGNRPSLCPLEDGTPPNPLCGRVPSKPPACIRISEPLATLLSPLTRAWERGGSRAASTREGADRQTTARNRNVIEPPYQRQIS
eukprot:gene23358-biopygen4322